MTQNYFTCQSIIVFGSFYLNSCLWEWNVNVTACWPPLMSCYCLCVFPYMFLCVLSDAVLCINGDARFSLSFFYVSSLVQNLHRNMFSSVFVIQTEFVLLDQLTIESWATFIYPIAFSSLVQCFFNLIFVSLSKPRPVSCNIIKCNVKVMSICVDSLVVHCVRSVTVSS